MYGFETCFGWEWNTVWTAFAAIGTVGAFAALLAPNINRWIRKQNKRLTLQKFFRERKLERFPTKTKSEAISLKVLNYIDSSKIRIKGTNNSHRDIIHFFKNSNVFFHDCKNLSLNGIQIEKGYNLYKILNDTCIQLEIINDNTGETQNAYIFKENNISLHLSKALTEDEDRELYEDHAEIIDIDEVGEPILGVSDAVYNKEFINDDIDNINAFERIVAWRFE